MRIFDSNVAGYDCTVQVLFYEPDANARLTEFEYQLVDEEGFMSGYLEDRVEDRDAVRLLEEYELIYGTDKYDSGVDDEDEEG